MFDDSPIVSAAVSQLKVFFFKKKNLIIILKTHFHMVQNSRNFLTWHLHLYTFLVDSIFVYAYILQTYMYVPYVNTVPRVYCTRKFR